MSSVGKRGGGDARGGEWWINSGGECGCEVCVARVGDSGWRVAAVAKAMHRGERAGGGALGRGGWAVWASRSGGQRAQGGVGRGSRTGPLPRVPGSRPQIWNRGAIWQARTSQTRVCGSLEPFQMH